MRRPGSSSRQVTDGGAWLRRCLIWLPALLLSNAMPAFPAIPRELRVGIAGHAFDHLGNIGEQAEAAAACGSTVIYATGLGGDGYLGLPARAEIEAKRKTVAAYVRQAVKGFESRGGQVVTTEKESWLSELRQRLARPSVTVQGPPSVRAVVRDQGRRTVVHLLNLNIQRLSSFEEKVTPALDIRLQVRVSSKKVHKVRLLTADEPQPATTVPFSGTTDKGDTVVNFRIGRLAVSAMAVIE